MKGIKRKWLILGGLTPLILVLDQVTKQYIHRVFRLHESIPVIKDFFDLTYVRNTGAAFGLLATADPAFRIPFFIIVPIVALVAISYIFRKVPDQDLRLSCALSLVIGGAMGNLIDRVIYGYVIDFLSFHWNNRYQFPAFNVADAAICVGVGILMLDLVFQPDEEAPSETKPGKDGGKDPAAPASKEGRDVSSSL